MREGEGCWLCKRLLGRRAQWHHTVPKAKGDREKVAVHSVCHRTIHANVTNAELARAGGSREVLLEQPVVAKFVAWVGDKPPDFRAPTKRKS